MSFHDVEAIYYDQANIMVSFRVGDAFTGDAPKNLVEIKNKNLIQVFEDGEMLSNREGAGTSVNRPSQFIVDLLVVVDISGSVEDKLTTVKQSLNSFVTQALINNKEGRQVRISIKTFDGAESTQQVVGFTSNLDELKKKIAGIKAGLDPSTNLFGAVVEAGKFMINHTVEGEISGNLKKKGMVFFTDGKDQAARATAEEALATLKAAKEELDFVYGVAVKGENYGGVNFLEYFGAKDKGYFLIDKNFKELEGNLVKIATNLHSYADSYFMARVCSPKRKGVHYLTFKIQGSDYGSRHIEFNANGFTGGCNIGNESQWTNPQTSKYLSSSALLTYSEMEKSKAFFAKIRPTESMVLFNEAAMSPSANGGWVSNYSSFDGAPVACHIYFPAGAKNIYENDVMSIVDYASMNGQYSNANESFIGVNFVVKSMSGSIYLLQCRELVGFGTESKISLENLYFEF